MFRTLYAKLPEMNALRELSLRSCDLKDAGMHELTQKLSQLTALRRLDLRHNMIEGPGGAEVVRVGALICLDTLSYVSLACTHVQYMTYTTLYYADIR
jgi:Ran GTPase-activating protein (RanGAP) involved in mRNA processing and transport